MSVQRVTITAAEEQHEPPDQEIDVAIVDDLVFITVYKGSAGDLINGRTKEYEVPELRLRDLSAAVLACRAAQKEDK